MGLKGIADGDDGSCGLIMRARKTLGSSDMGRLGDVIY